MRSAFIKLFLLSVFIACLAPLLSPTKADASLAGFNPERIIEDAVMANKNSMSEAAIQSFLKSKNPCNDSDYSKYLYYTNLGYSYNWRDGHFVCMADDNFNGETAAHIIWQAAQDYNVNPQVLIVLLQKEQSLVTDTWPNSTQYMSATGFACYDNGQPCQGYAAGFKVQVRKAANLFHEVLDNRDYDGDGFITNYPVGVNYVQYNPNAACGGTNLNIQTRATSALYRYTPYQPNAYALGGGSSSAYPQCGAFGNRNFYDYFTGWFGSTVYGNLIKTAGGGVYYIDNGLKRVFPSELVFLSYDYKWSNVTTITPSLLALIPDGAPMTYNTGYREGRLVTTTNQGVFLVDNGKKRPIVSEVAFISNSYRWTDVLSISATEFSLIPEGIPSINYNVRYREGRLIKSPINGGIYLIQNGVKRPIPSVEIFQSYGLLWTDAISVDDNEFALIPDGLALPMK